MRNEMKILYIDKKNKNKQMKILLVGDVLGYLVRSCLVSDAQMVE